MQDLKLEELRWQVQHAINAVSFNGSTDPNSIAWALTMALQALDERLRRLEDTGIVERFKKAEVLK